MAMAERPPSDFTRSDGEVVKKTDAVPENISFGRLNDIGPLADGEFWLGDNRCNSRLVLFKFVLKLSEHLFMCGPLLPFPAYELPGIFTNRAMFNSGEKLGSAGDTNWIHSHCNGGLTFQLSSAYRTMFLTPENFSPLSAFIARELI